MCTGDDRYRLDLLLTGAYATLAVLGALALRRRALDRDPVVPTATRDRQPV